MFWILKPVQGTNWQHIDYDQQNRANQRASAKYDTSISTVININNPSSLPVITTDQGKTQFTEYSASDKLKTDTNEVRIQVYLHFLSYDI